jgi:exodeoxyribonuclease-3
MSWSVATFNVNGIRARVSIVLDWLRLNTPDVLCLQEIKCQNDQFPLEPFRELGYSCWVYGQKSFNGVATLSKREPEEVIRGFLDGEPEDEARLIATRIDRVWVLNTYVPQGRDPADPAFQKKLGYLSKLKLWLESRFRREDPVVWVGDLNVAMENIDVFDPKRMQGKIGFHPEEKMKLADTMSWGFVDVFRMHNPDKRQFTFWDYRLPKSFDRNLGWRIDYICATEPMAKISLGCEVDEAPRSLPSPSDHTLVVARFDLARL